MKAALAGHNDPVERQNGALIWSVRVVSAGLSRCHVKLVSTTQPKGYDKFAR